MGHIANDGGLILHVYSISPLPSGQKLFVHHIHVYGFSSYGENVDNVAGLADTDPNQ